MWSESSDEEAKRPLRTGLTTGTCATACCVAAGQYLLANKQIELVSVTLPSRKKAFINSDTKQKNVELTITGFQSTANGLRTQTIKDAGDDPDVTHQATVFVELQLSPQSGIIFKAGKGVGTVTRDGLSLGVGEPAINPVPRQMINEHLTDIANEYDYKGGFIVIIGIEDGEALALKTMNPRLGILGGLSILGTSGIVRPFSCAAYIASIHQGIDVAAANNISHLCASTGNRSEQALLNRYDLPDMAMIEMGDFAGAVLKYLKDPQITKLSLCGGFGKMTKLANGHLDLHSAKSSIDLQHLSDLAKKKGADAALQKSIVEANTSIEALQLCDKKQIPLADAVCEEAWKFAKDKLPDYVALEILVINRVGEIVGFTDGNKRAMR